MRTVFTAAVLAVVLVVCGGAAAAAQEVSNRQRAKTYELVLSDGSRLYGTVESESETEIVFRTIAGISVTTALRDVVSLRQVSGSFVRGEFMPADPNTTRLFFGPTGRSLAKGDVYLGVYEFLLPFVQVGVTDRFSIGGGTPLYFSTEDDWSRPFWITPKLQVYNGASTQVSAGAFLGFGGGSHGGIVYGVLTHGTVNGSFTAGAGMAYAADGGRAPVVMVGGDRRVRRNMKVVTESYLWKGGNGFASAGVRFFGEQLSADLGLAVPIGADEVFAFPIVNFVYAF